MRTKIFFISLLSMMLPFVLSAETIEIDGICYNVITKGQVAEVVKKTSGYYRGDIVIPASVTYQGVNCSVTSIGDKAFNGCSGLTSVTIPNSVTSIGESAFYGCNLLTSVHITDLNAWFRYKFTSAESNPLFYAHHLYLNGEEIKNLDIPNSVTSIDYSAFAGCSGLTSVTIPSSVTSIGSYAFFGCSGLTSVIIPNSVTYIGWNAFDSCSGLTSVIIPNSVTSISHYAFFRCSGLTTVIIPNSVSLIREYAFSKCIGLTSVTIPNSVTSIRQAAFSECSGLTSVTIPSSVTSIDEEAFSGCSSLTSVIIPNSVKSINKKAFRGCIGLTSVTIPSSVISIGESAFSECSGLISVTIPNSITIISSQAFNGCTNLSTIELGKSVKTIANGAFANCENISDVFCLAKDVPSTHPDAFNGSYIDFATLHVPAASVYSYEAAEPWKNFQSIVSTEGGETPETLKCETPTISYKNGKLTFNCATDGAECVTSISDADIKTHYGNEITLTATYNISVYATKTGYDNSDVTSATLCWIDQKPATEGITDGIANVPAKALLIKNNGGQFTIEGTADGEVINVYTVNGVQSGSAISQNGAACIDTNLQAGSIAIVKIGDKSVKVVIK